MFKNLTLKTTAIVALMMFVLPMVMVMMPSVMPTVSAAGIIPTTAWTAECAAYTSPYNGTGWGTVPPSKAIDGVLTDASRWAFGSSSYAANLVITRYVTLDLGVVDSSAKTFNMMYFYINRVASTGFTYQSASLSYGDTVATGTDAPAMTFTTNAADNIGTGTTVIQKYTTDQLATPITARYVKFSITYKNTSGVTKTAMPAVVEIGLDNISGAVPTASDVAIAGTAGVGNLLTGSYTYDSSVAEGASILQWQECGTVGGAYANISGANSLTFTPTQDQIGKFIQFRVTPVDADGLVGAPVSSSATNQIGGTLATPPLPTIPGKTCAFVASAGATMHIIEISKADVGVVGTIENAVSPQDFTSIIVENGPGSYSVTVQAIGDGTTFITSDKSEVATKSFFTATYHNNMGIGTTPVTTTIYTIGSFIMFPANELTRTDYTFMGYATEPGVDGAGAGTLYPTTMSPWRTTPNAESPYNIDLYAMWAPNSCTVSVNSGGGVTNGSVVANPESATVGYNETVTFTITPDAGYQINTLKFDGGDITVNGNNEYTTPALTAANTAMVVTFKKIPATAPAINVTPTHKVSETINVTPRGGAAIDKLIPASFISYATINVPVVYELVSYGMKLIDVLNPTKAIDLPIINKNGNGQFAVQVFGDGFVVGNTYQLQSYINYTEDGIEKTILGALNEFIWE